MSSTALITLEISDFFPQNFPFDDFCFIFSSDSHDFESEIYYLSKNQITHKSPLAKKDIRYSIKILRNDSLIGISDFIIPSSLLNQRENLFEKICIINMTDSTKRILFGNLSQNNNLRINVRARINYLQGQGVKNNKKIFSPKSSGINAKKNIGIGDSSSPKVYNVNNMNNNNINPTNFVFNKQQIPMQKKVPIMKTSSASNTNNINNNINNNNINIGNRYNKRNMNMADIILQQQQQQNQNNISNPNNVINKPKNPKNNYIPKSAPQQQDDPTDTSVIYPEVSNPVQPIDEEFTEFMQKFIEKNPLEQLSQFNDINEMMTYTKNVIDKLLCYQQEYYERLKTSIALNNRLNELLVKYNEKYRNIVKKVHRLNEETNSNDMRKDAVVNVHRTENSNLKQIIPLKMKELKLSQEMCGDNIKDILLQTKEKNKNINNEKNMSNISNINIKKKNIYMKLLKNCVKNYGPFESLFNKENLEQFNNNEQQKKIIENIKQELNKEKENKEEENINKKLEFVITEVPDELDIKLNQYLTSIYSENRLPKIKFIKIKDNLYQYGSQNVTVVNEDNMIKIKYEEGDLLLDNFIEINAQAEEEKIMQINQE